MDFVVGVIADLPEAWAAYKKSSEAAARAAREKAEAEAKRAAEPPAPPKPAATKAAETAAAVAAKSAKTAVAATKTAAKTAKTAVAATKTAVTVVKRAWAKRVAVRPYVVEELAKRGKAVPAAAVLNAYETRRRCVVAMTNLSGDRSLPWRMRLRCFAALLRLSVKGGSRPYLIVSVGGFAHALRALEQWVESKTAGAPLETGSGFRAAAEPDAPRRAGRAGDADEVRERAQRRGGGRDPSGTGGDTRGEARAARGVDGDVGARALGGA